MPARALRLGHPFDLRWHRQLWGARAAPLAEGQEPFRGQKALANLPVHLGLPRELQLEGVLFQVLDHLRELHHAPPAPNPAPITPVAGVEAGEALAACRRQDKCDKALAGSRHPARASLCPLACALLLPMPDAPPPRPSHLCSGFLKISSSYDLPGILSKPAHSVSNSSGVKPRVSDKRDRFTPCSPALHTVLSLCLRAAHAFVTARP